MCPYPTALCELEMRVSTELTPPRCCLCTAEALGFPGYSRNRFLHRDTQVMRMNTAQNSSEGRKGRRTRRPAVRRWRDPAATVAHFPDIPGCALGPRSALQGTFPQPEGAGRILGSPPFLTACEAPGPFPEPNGSSGSLFYFRGGEEKERRRTWELRLCSLTCQEHSPSLPSLTPCPHQSPLKLELPTGCQMRDKGAWRHPGADRIWVFPNCGAAPETLLPQVALTQFERNGSSEQYAYSPSGKNSRVCMWSVHRYILYPCVCTHIRVHLSCV